jgi:murein DD-endopeptidase MepM/ murein hydrolase activator NlpD
VLVVAVCALATPGRIAAAAGAGARTAGDLAAAAAAPVASAAASAVSGRADVVAAAAAATGSSSAGDVAALQVALRVGGLYDGSVDGIAGPATNGAVRAFQARAGLVVDGIAGPRTRRALGWRGRPSLDARVMTAGARGWDVAAAQFLLARAGFPSGPFDGVAGPRFTAALQRFQTWAGLAADGVAGPATIAALGRPPPRSPLRFRFPVAVPVGDRFGPRGDSFHTGVDFPAPTGTPVAAASAGCVVSASFDDGYGLLVVLRHTLGVTTWYAHLSRIDVRPGACVTAGARLGAVGATGHATGPHLHFEVRVRGAATDPLLALG